MTVESQQGQASAESAAPTGIEMGQTGHGHHGDGTLKLAVGAVGVVFG